MPDSHEVLGTLPGASGRRLQPSVSGRSGSWGSVPIDVEIGRRPSPRGSAKPCLKVHSPGFAPAAAGTGSAHEFVRLGDRIPIGGGWGAFGTGVVNRNGRGNLSEFRICFAKAPTA